MNLTMRSFEKDVENWMCTYGTPEVLSNGTPCIRGRDDANKKVYAAYLKAEAYDPLISSVLIGYRSDDFIEPLHDALLKKKDLSRLTRLWLGLIAEHKIRFWQAQELALNPKHQWRETTVVGRNGVIKMSAEEVKREFLDVSLPNLKHSALKVMRRFDEVLQLLDGQGAASKRLREDMALLENNKRRKSNVKPDKRKMDEDLFWQLIEGSHAISDDVSSQLLALTDLIEKFTGPAIERFQKLLQEKMTQACHYDIWALAYLAQGGCSDDAFEMFRAWLILQGRTVYHSAITDVKSVLSFVPAGLSTQADQLLSCARIAYENRTGLPLKEGTTALSVVLGEEWTEENVGDRYPLISKHYRNIE